MPEMDGHAVSAAGPGSGDRVARVPVDPVTAAKLADFGRRRRRLILARGVCAALAILLGTMSAVALVDWLFVLLAVAVIWFLFVR